MKQIIFLGICLFGLLLPSCKEKSDVDATTKGEVAAGHSEGAAYDIDLPRTTVKWSAFKPTGTHNGIFPVTKGTIYVKNELITGGAIEMNMAGLQVLDLNGEMKDKLEGHLKGTVAGKEDDFFNVEKYPTATFTIRSSQKLQNDPVGSHMIHGDLKIKNISKPVSFKATLDFASGTAVKGTTEPFIIDRTQWDIKFQSRKFFDNLKDDYVNDEVKLDITLGAVIRI